MKREFLGRRRLGRTTEVSPRKHAVLRSRATTNGQRSTRDPPFPREEATCVLSPKMRTYKFLLRSSPLRCTFQWDRKREAGKTGKARQQYRKRKVKSQVARNAQRVKEILENLSGWLLAMAEVPLKIKQHFGAKVHVNLGHEFSPVVVYPYCRGRCERIKPVQTCEGGRKTAAAMEKRDGREEEGGRIDQEWRRERRNKSMGKNGWCSLFSTAFPLRSRTF